MSLLIERNLLNSRGYLSIQFAFIRWTMIAKLRDETDKPVFNVLILSLPYSKFASVFLCNYKSVSSAKSVFPRAVSKQNWRNSLNNLQSCPPVQIDRSHAIRYYRYYYNQTSHPFHIYFLFYLLHELRSYSEYQNRYLKLKVFFV